MTSVRLNILANYAGSFWTGMMGIIFVPQYIKFMGIESYGLVGVFSSLLTIFALFDMGLSVAINREMARGSALNRDARQLRNLARTLEIIYWCVAVLIGGSVILLADPISKYWVNPDRLSREAVGQAITIMGFVVALRWPASLYLGGLMGLQKQLGVSVVSSSCATIRGVGAVLVLWLIEPSIRAFFLFQIVASAAETSALMVYLWISLPPEKKRPRFDIKLLSEVWWFSAGMAGTSVFTLILTQTDKVILSRMLSLEDFGYYTLAWTAASILYRIMAPLDSAIYPRLTQLVALQDVEQLTLFYHKASQAMSVILLPATMVLAIFSEKVLFVWTGDPGISHYTAPILSLLAVGTCLNGFMHIPYYAQLAYGWVSLGFWMNAASTIILAPMIVVCTSLYGPVGAATGWVALNSGYLLIGIGLMHRRIFKDQKWVWYFHDVGLPTGAAVLGGLVLAYWIVPSTEPRWAMLASLSLTGTLGLAMTMMAAPMVRHVTFTTIRTYLKTQRVWEH